MMLLFTTKTKKLLLAVILLFTASSATFSQSVIDGFMKGKGHGSVVLSYSWEQYDMFYLADMKTDAPPPYGGQITTQSINLYGTVGLSDNVDLVANIPYIAAAGDGNSAMADQEVSNLQDVAVFIKWRPIVVNTEQGDLSFLGALGFATPLSDYAADEILSIGNHATRVDARLLTQYKSTSGIFAELQAGYSLRSNDVPNATILSSKIGYAGAKIYVNIWAETQISDSDAPDIGDPGFMTDFSFKETRVNYTQIGASVYYPIVPSLGFTAGIGKYVSGRNVGLATRLSGGIIYNF